MVQVEERLVTQLDALAARALQRDDRLALCEQRRKDKVRERCREVVLARAERAIGRRCALRRGWRGRQRFEQRERVLRVTASRGARLDARGIRTRWRGAAGMRALREPNAMLFSARAYSVLASFTSIEVSSSLSCFLSARLLTARFSMRLMLSAGICGTPVLGMWSTVRLCSRPATAASRFRFAQSRRAQKHAGSSASKQMKSRCAHTCSALVLCAPCFASRRTA